MEKRWVIKERQMKDRGKTCHGNRSLKSTDQSYVQRNIKTPEEARLSLSLISYLHDPFLMKT